MTPWRVVSSMAVLRVVPLASAMTLYSCLAAASMPPSVPPEIDLNGDGIIVKAELKLFLERTLQARLAAVGFSAKPTSPEFIAYVREQTNSVFNNANVNDPLDQDEILPNEVAAMNSTSLNDPLSGTIADLLPATPPTPPAKKSWTEHLESWVDIRQSFLDEQAVGKPAKASFTTQAKSDETVDEGDPRRVGSVQAAIVVAPAWEWTPASRFSMSPVVAYEAKIVSNKPADDLVVHRVGFQGVLRRELMTSPFSSHIFDVTFDYRTDRGYDAKVYGATVQYSPTWRKIGIGQYVRRGAAIDFRWRPYVGVVWGDVKEPGVVEAYAEMDDFTYPFLRLGGELKLSERLLVTPEATFWRGERTDSGGDTSRGDRIGSLSIRLILSKSDDGERASVELGLKQGRDLPNFEFEKSLEIALAFKF
jgi:hypothetical protein